MQRFAFLIVIFWSAIGFAELTADDLALVVNQNDADSLPLAQFYCTARHVPIDRIIQLSLPNVDEISFEQYERDVAAPVRQFLTDHPQLRIKCLVTFYGIPLRISDRKSSPRDDLELTRLREARRVIFPKANAIVTDVESHAKLFDPSFITAPAGDTFESVMQRENRAAASITQSMSRAQDPKTLGDIQQYVAQARAAITAPCDVVVANSDPMPTSQPTNAQVDALNFRLTYDPAARAEMRGIAKQFANTFENLEIIDSEIQAMATAQTGAAVDSELSLVQWPRYQRTQWLGNPMSPRFAGVRTPPFLMTMRLDAPSPEIVRQIIIDSLRVEKTGLKGKFVIDARGMPPQKDGKPDPMGMMDESLRLLAELVKNKTSMPVQLDNQPDVLPPGSADEVALYCGWYSVQNYVAGMKFVPGAVGYHIASFELISLRGGTNGWARGLLKDGIAGTLGPVAEPYLHSFPPPMEFFPLLMTGKYSLAETYWKTTPLTSWMISFIGDPLYNPFKNAPAMKVEDLPDALRPAIN